MLKEPILDSARTAYRVAQRLCRKDSASGNDCSWYHGLWQYLRLFNLVATPAQNAGFFLDALGTLAREGRYRRVLVSGTADYSMPAHVLWAYRMENAVVDVTVVDLCETPLFLSRWYAERVSATVKTHAGDILDYECAKPFDVICTHGFLRRFAPEGRKSLVAKWRGLLRPGGKVVTTKRIVPPLAQGTVRFRRGQVEAFRNATLREAQKWRDFLDADLEELGRQAELFAERKARSRIPGLGSAREIAELFEGGGFAIDRLESVDVPLKASQITRGREASKSAEHAQVVATRR